MKKVYRNTAYLISGRLVGDVMVFVLFVLLSRTFGEAALGKYVLAMAVTSLFFQVVNGPRELVVREIARHTEIGSRYVGGLLSAQAGLALTGFVLLGSWNWLLPFDSETFALILILFVYQISWAFGRGLLSQADASEEMGWPAALGFLLKVTISVVGLTLLWLGKPLVSVVSAYAVGGVLYLLMAAILKVGLYGLPQFPELGFVKHLLWLGLPFALEPLVWVVCSRADVVMLTYFLGNQAAGIYAFPYKVLEMSGAMFFLYGTALYPVFARLYPSDREELRKVFTHSQCAIFVLGSLAMLTVLFGAGPGIRMLFHGKFIESIIVFKVMSWFALTIALQVVYFRLLLAANKQQYILRVVAIATLFNVGLNFVLIPRWGVVGAVIATLCSEVILLFGFELAAGEILGRRRPLRKVVTATMVLLIPVATGICVQRWIAVGPTILLVWVVFLGLLLATGMVQVRQVNKLFGLARVLPR